MLLPKRNSTKFYKKKKEEEEENKKSKTKMQVFFIFILFFHCKSYLNKYLLHKTKINATMNLFQETFPAFFFLFFFYSRHFILPKSFSNSLFLLFFLSRSNSITVLLNNIRLYCNQLPATFCCCCCVKKYILV